MAERVSELETRVSELTETVRQMERRLAALEQGRAPVARRARAAGGAGDATAASLQSDVAAATRTLSLLGRTLLVLAGAFVLRAFTDAGTFPAWLGVGLGFVYAGTWVAAADRAGAVDRSASAVFHLVAAIVIGFPLLFEAATRFRLLAPLPAAAMLALFTGVALGVASRRRQEALAWLIAFGGVFTAVGLMLASGRVAPALGYLVLLGVATLWLGYVRDWHGLRWPLAVAADLATVALVLRAVHPGGAEGPRTAIVVALALMGLYLGSFATRTLLLHREVVPFEAAQTAAVLLVGLGGASYVATSAGMGETALGLASVVFGLASYAVAFAFVERREQERRRNFYFYTSVALVLVLAGTGFALPGSMVAVGWAALAVAVGALSRGFGRDTLAAHAAVYAIAGGVASGLLEHAGEALVSPSDTWTPATVVSFLVLVAMAGTAWITVRTEARTAVERIPRFLLVAAVAAGAAGLAVGAIAPLAAGSPGAIATIRTAVLATGALILACAGRCRGWVEASWLVYPLLATVGLKILLEDLPRSRPATLFLAFALYGAALILVPRIRRRAAATGPAGTARA